MKDFIYKIVPRNALLPLIGLVCLQFLVYGGTRLITKNWYHHSPSLPIDSKIPLMPWFILIYVGCYAYWVINYIICANLGQDHFSHFAKAVAIGYIICGILFVVYPTTIERPDVSSVGGLNGFLMKLIYSADTPDNLFPSMHCLISWYCWIAVRNSDKVPMPYQIFSFVFTILVCISTVTVKQHFVVDIIAGVGIAELSWLLTKIRV